MLDWEWEYTVHLVGGAERIFATATELGTARVELE